MEISIEQRQISYHSSMFQAVKDSCQAGVSNQSHCSLLDGVYGVPSVVPQESHLGPLLFNIYVNDISSCFHFADFLLFADDLKFYMKVRKTQNCLGLQSNLDRLAGW